MLLSKTKANQRGQWSTCSVCLTLLHLNNCLLNKLTAGVLHYNSKTTHNQNVSFFCCCDSCDVNTYQRVFLVINNLNAPTKHFASAFCINFIYIYRISTYWPKIFWITIEQSCKLHKPEHGFVYQLGSERRSRPMQFRQSSVISVLLTFPTFLLTEGTAQFLNQNIIKPCCLTKCLEWNMFIAL